MRRIRHHEDGLGLTELCEVYATDAPHPVNGANHAYRLIRRLTGEEAEVLAARAGGTAPTIIDTVHFQRGPRGEPDSTPGLLDGCLLSVLIDRYECFQAGPFGCPENEEVLAHLRAALDAIKARARERAARGVLGKNTK